MPIRHGVGLLMWWVASAHYLQGQFEAEPCLSGGNPQCSIHTCCDVLGWQEMNSKQSQQLCPVLLINLSLCRHGARFSSGVTEIPHRWVLASTDPKPRWK